MEESPPMEKT